MKPNPSQMAAKMALLFRRALSFQKFIEVVFETPLDTDTLEVIDMVLDCVCLNTFQESYMDLDEQQSAVLEEAIARFRTNGREAYQEVFTVKHIGEA